MVAEGGSLQITTTIKMVLSMPSIPSMRREAIISRPAPRRSNRGCQQRGQLYRRIELSDGKGNATIYATYRNINAVIQSKYSVQRLYALLRLCDFQSGQLSCGGSGTTYP